MRLGVAVMLCSSAYRRMNGRDRRVSDGCSHGLHLAKVFAQCFRYAKVTLDQTEHGSGTHAAHDLLLRHRPSCVTSSRKSSIQTLFHDRISSLLFPLAFPQLDDLDKVTEVGGVLSGLCEQFSHGFPLTSLTSLPVHE